MLLHIEKTGGTSLRDAFAAAFGPGRCEMLYGSGSRTTTPAMQAAAYDEARGGEALDERWDRVAERLLRLRPAFFATHAIGPMRERLHGHAQFVTVFREPVARIVSHYNHWHRLGEVRSDFEAFYRTPAFADWQSNRFTPAQVDELAAVGVTERWDDTLRVMEARFGLRLPPVRHNRTGLLRSRVRAERLDEATRAAIERLCAADRAIHAHAVGRLAADCGASAMAR